ncbi:electron transfer flavoprotein subunit alpha [Thermodesulfovibrio thiophilus]|uniref:electron transfer flavoprotein subunit alpha n=1 Tax=Thermodesulfovibrio thiophilus TaxID=340095 RepID=UPI0017DBAAD7|nr:electron transfer flavoprotein subunit alpha [Thermodesulfovibrio thiophilus]HHW20177.1 electron transfer flavoprotein subunit alpha [Thermodesulfovibrio thiophilus]
MFIRVNIEKCTGCGTCIDVCPYAAIIIKDDKAFITDACTLCGACVESCPEGAILDERGKEVEKPKDFKGVWIFAEQSQGKIASVAYELLGIGRKLADELKSELCAVLFGESDEVEELIKWGADKVYYVNSSDYTYLDDDLYSKTLVKLVNEYKPEIILAGATAIGRSFIPRVAARLRVGLTADCTSLEIDKETGNLLQIRPAFGGNIMATIICPNSRPQIATVRPRVMKPGEYNPSKNGEIIKIDSLKPSGKVKVLERIEDKSFCRVNLQDAKVIVSGGRGIGGPEDFKMLWELANLLGGTVGASRAAVDEGWIPYAHQIGQTGKTVCPKIYIACGISGAVQHLVGMQSSDIIVAINKDPNAPIFNVATYGIVGDAKEIIPLIIKKLKQGVSEC